MIFQFSRTLSLLSNAYLLAISLRLAFCKKIMSISHVNYILILVKDSQVVAIHPSCVLSHKPLFVLYHELVLTKKNYMRTVVDINPKWFYEIAPDYFKPESVKNVETRKALAKVEKEYI